MVPFWIVMMSLGTSPSTSMSRACSMSARQFYRRYNQSPDICACMLVLTKFVALLFAPVLDDYSQKWKHYKHVISSFKSQGQPYCVTINPCLVLYRIPPSHGPFLSSTSPYPNSLSPFLFVPLSSHLSFLPLSPIGSS